jgi:hypothetical protein
MLTLQPLFTYILHKLTNSPCPTFKMCSPIVNSTETKAEDFSPAQSLSEDQQELSKILRALRQDPSLMGCISLGKDGIMRSLTADRDVVDAVAFSPGLIKAMLDRMPFDQKMEDDYRGVDGTNLPREEWFHPDKSLLPQPLSEEARERTMKLITDNKELYAERLKVLENRSVEHCSVVVRSDYNLGPRSE